MKKTVAEWYILVQDNPIAQQILEDWVHEKEVVIWVLKEIGHPNLVLTQLEELQTQEYYQAKDEKSNVDQISNQDHGFMGCRI